MPESFFIAVTLLVLAGVIIAFVKEVYEPHLIALTGMAVLLAVGAISTKDMLSVFSNRAPITIACMFVISAALDQTGIVDMMGRLLLRISEKRKSLGITSLLLFVLLLSAFMNNTPVVIILTPVVMTLAKELQDSPSKYLIPLSYTAIMGGACTMIGTSTNILVDGVAQENGLMPFQVFEITGAGLIMAAAGLTFLALFGRYLLPDRQAPKDELLDEIPVKRFWAEAIISPNSPLIGQALGDVKFTENEDYEIIDLVRKQAGTNKSHSLDKGDQGSVSSVLYGANENRKGLSQELTSFREMKLEAGDKLLFKLSKDEVVELKKHVGIEFNLPSKQPGKALPPMDVEVVEAVLSPTSSFIGRRIKNLRLLRAYGCLVLALHREEKNVIGNLENIILRPGDSLIIEGRKSDLKILFESEQVFNASSIRGFELNRQKAIISVLTVISFVALSALRVMPISGLALISAVTVMITGCVSSKKVYRGIDWRVLLMIFGMLGIGKAMENTGVVHLLVADGGELVKGFGPLALLAVIYALTSLLTEIVTNSAVAVLLPPIVIALATSLGYDPRPFVVAIMFAASASFATPIGYQTNTYVYAAGGYQFKDFLRIGIPMNIIMLIVAITIIPIFWPF